MDELKEIATIPIEKRYCQHNLCGKEIPYIPRRGVNRHNKRKYCSYSCGSKVNIRNKRPVKKGINWFREFAYPLSFDLEKSMWDELYVKRDWGSAKIAEHLGCSGMSILNRLRKLNYVIKPKGGPNRLRPYRLKYRDGE